MIPKEAWTEKKQDVNYIKIFGSVVNYLILKKKIQIRYIQKLKKNIYRIHIRIEKKYSLDIAKIEQNTFVLRP